MATNEHFLLVHLADTVNALNRAAFTVGEVIQDVKKARIKAKLKNGSRTNPLVMKALRKLVFNDHIRLLDVGGQTGFRFTAHGITQFKRAMKDYPQRKRRASRSTFSLRARDVSCLGSVLKKRLVRESDDILDEMKHGYLISIRGRNVSPPSPSPGDQSDHRNPVQSLLFAELRSADFPERYPSFRDIASDSESDRPRLSTPESEQEQYSMMMPNMQNGSPSPSSVGFPISSFGVRCASPQLFVDTATPLCEGRNGNGKEKESADFFVGPFQSQDERRTPDRSPRRRSLDSDTTLVDSSSLCDYLPFTSLDRGKRVKKSKGDKCRARSSSPEYDLIDSPVPVSRSGMSHQKRSMRQDTLLRRRKERMASGRYHPYEDIGETPCSKLEKHPKRLLLSRR